MNTDFWEGKLEQDNWYPANGGTETPFSTKGGRRFLYCFNPKQGKHAYLDLNTDMIVPNELLYLEGL